MKRLAILLLLTTATFGAQASSQDSSRLLRATDEPHNWMMYSGSYMSQRYSTLN